MQAACGPRAAGFPPLLYDMPVPKEERACGVPLRIETTVELPARYDISHLGLVRSLIMSLITNIKLMDFSNTCKFIASF